jgi:RNA polymerase sigma factor (sigma-70 family)
VTNRLLHTVLRRVDALTADATPDAMLARRFAESRDEPAFALLVHRHGPMVWAVCRQMLTDPADSDDAFQAVFVALIQSANKLGRVKSLGGWLHGAAVRVCLKARRSAVRRKRREQATAKPEAACPLPDWADLHAAVHEEVERLPDSLRTAFVLCDLQGVRQPDAAAQLGWKLGTLSGRLTRARQALLKKLTARGLAPLTGVGAVGAATVGGLPAAVAEQAFALVRNGADWGGLSSTVLELAHGATEGMMTKAKWTVGSLMLAGGLMVTAGTGWLPTTDAQQPARTRPGAGPGFGSGAGPDSRPASEPAPAAAPRAADVAPTADPTLAPKAENTPRPARTTPGAGPGTGWGVTTAAGGQRFEHTVLDVPNTREEFVKLVQKQEKAGWEFCGPVHAEADAIKLYTVLVFKRPKGGTATASTTWSANSAYGAASGDLAPSPAVYTPSAGSYPTDDAYAAGRTPTLAPTPSSPTTEYAPSSRPAPTTPPAKADAGYRPPSSDPNTIPARREEPTTDTTEAKLPSGFEVVPLKHARAAEVAKTLRELFTSDEPTGGFGRTQPFTVSSDDRTNSVIFRPGRGVTSRDVKAMIEKLDGESSKSSAKNPFNNVTR